MESYSNFSGIMMNIFHSPPSLEDPTAKSGVTNGILLDLIEMDCCNNGLSLSAFCYSAREKNGLNITLFTLYGIEKVHGVQISGFDIDAENNSSIEGLQLALFTRATVDGMQIGAITKNSPNTIDHSTPTAVNMGLLNFGEMDGVQIGLFNSLSDGDAWQFGLLNYNENGILPIMPFFNCKWGD